MQDWIGKRLDLKCRKHKHRYRGITPPWLANMPASRPEVVWVVACVPSPNHPWAVALRRGLEIWLLCPENIWRNVTSNISHIIKLSQQNSFLLFINVYERESQYKKTRSQSYQTFLFVKRIFYSIFLYKGWPCICLMIQTLKLNSKNLKTKFGRIDFCSANIMDIKKN